jgi:hypothetical protein
MSKVHHIGIIQFSGSVMRIEVDGKVYDIDLAAQSPRLARATQQQRENVAVSPAGYGLHWPEIDEDLSIDGLIGVKHTSPPARVTA